ncbi:MAG: class II aldolase/adducin family protein [Phycisphaerae bacterium]|nr:class II aldolase/adducin family protein [Phycisphaerae bacterium]MDW8262236.1 class II aldolase/adducin family protein [Phycisphaerales bacterium]
MIQRATILQELLAMSRALGRPQGDLVILAEGNTSARLPGGTFAVKSSGASLETLTEDGLVECRTQPLLKLLDGPLPDDEVTEKALMDARVDPRSRKPSVEAVFHAVLLELPGVSFVGHTHPTSVNSILCSARAGAFARQRRYPDEIVCCGPESLLVPYVDPGIALAREIHRLAGEFVQRTGAAPRAILLQNHGLIALGGSTASVLATTTMMEKAARIFLGAEQLGGAEPLSPQDVARIASRPDEHYRQRLLKM